MRAAFIGAFFAAALLAAGAYMWLQSPALPRAAGDARTQHPNAAGDCVYDVHACPLASLDANAASAERSSAHAAPARAVARAGAGSGSASAMSTSASASTGKKTEGASADGGRAVAKAGSAEFRAGKPQPSASAGAGTAAKQKKNVAEKTGGGTHAERKPEKSAPDTRSVAGNALSRLHDARARVQPHARPLLGKGHAER